LLRDSRKKNGVHRCRKAGRAAVRSGSSCTMLPVSTRVYPIEIDLARTIASGKAVTDVTWKVVAELKCPACPRAGRGNEGSYA
jgi:hypothetical protein